MSLFGGGDSAPQSPASHDDAPTPFPLSRSPTPPNVQIPPLVSFALDSDEHDNDDAEDEDEDNSDSELDQVPSRPNRFNGKPQTWRRYTAADREVVASLEKIESADLAAHLYNAHHLKRRVRRPAEQLAEIKNWGAKDGWLKKGEELQFTNPYGELETELIPGKHWTAWPLPPKLLYQQQDNVLRSDSDEDTWCIGGSGAQDAGDIMREETLALFLRQAKEKWLSRATDISNDEMKKTPSKQKSHVKPEAKGIRSDGSQSATTHSESVSDIETQDDDGFEEGKHSTSESEPNEKYGNILGKSHTSYLPTSKPVFLADDDEARRILQPSVDSLLAQLDHLALALRRSRFNRFGEGSYRYSGRSGSEFTSDPESAVISRASSRSRSKTKTGKKASIQPSSRIGDASKTKKRQQKSKTQRFNDSDSSSDSAGGREMGSEAKSSTPENFLLERSRGMSKKPRQDSDSSNVPSYYQSVGKMDWSEVLGMASMTGWDELAVARAAQRCAALFGEGMDFRTFDESLATQPIPEPVAYTPSTIPAPDGQGIAASSASKRPYFDVASLRCPHKDCERGEKGSWGDFTTPYRVVQHVRRVHGYDPRTNDSDNEERTVGGVHIDGFLQPITAKHGWLGGKRSKAGVIKTETRVGRAKRQKVKRKHVSPIAGGDMESMED